MTDVIAADNAANEEFEIIGMETNWLRKMVSDLTKASTAKQVTVGGLTGWCAGHVFVKVSRLASIALGSSLLVVMVAHHTGYIAIDWGRLEHKVRQTRRKIENEANRALPRLTTEVQEFIQENFFLSGAFAGGFLIGMAT
ncbi:FUN14 domain-containing protein 1 [Lamellibrachia satsuma]|nr:FUN14 domain-containing protein 1 [Lamellibrachia satsuma]